MPRYRLSVVVDVDEAALERERHLYPHATPKSDDPNTWSPRDLASVLGNGGDDRRFHPVRGASLVTAEPLPDPQWQAFVDEHGDRLAGWNADANR
jgi:hypothetical protein